MPSEKVLELKKQQVAELKERLGNACAGVVVSYEGISVADDTKLRKELREAGVKYTVTKNTLIHLAIEGTDLAGLDNVLSGTTAIATSDDDYAAAARILSKYAESSKTFEIKSGFIDNEVINLRALQIFLQEKYGLLLFAVHSTHLLQLLHVQFRQLLIRAVKKFLHLRLKRLPQKKLHRLRKQHPQQKKLLLNNI